MGFGELAEELHFRKCKCEVVYGSCRKRREDVTSADSMSTDAFSQLDFLCTGECLAHIRWLSDIC
jgi:hypothetical protein